MKDSCTRFIRPALGLAGLVALSSCTHVKPWERGRLADPVMKAGGDAHAVAISEHMWFTREAFSGGRGVGGGGCGCN